MSIALSKLKIGDQISIKGPLGSFIWHQDGNCTWKSQVRKVRQLAMICAGSGITPIIQVIRAIFDDQTDDKTRIWLIDANRSVYDLYQLINTLSQAIDHSS